MLKIYIVSVGKIKEKYLRDAVEEYLKRLGRYCEVNITEVAEYRCGDNPSEEEIKTVLDNEGKAIISKIPRQTAVIPLCIEGKQMRSTAFAEKISELSLNYPSITFVIGGSFGLSDEVKNLGTLRMSMSEMTFPHMLARVILLEQIYRAMNILNNGKYHK